MLSKIVNSGTVENIIKAKYNSFSDRVQYSGAFISILHEYVLIVRKDTPILMPSLTTKRAEVDVRDMRGAKGASDIIDVFDGISVYTTWDMVLSESVLDKKTYHGGNILYGQ